MKQREIKFRAWFDGKAITQTVYVNGHDAERVWVPRKRGMEMIDLCEQYADTTEWYFAKCYAVAIMQYTGLKDKNGKEIYEGDIVDPAPEDNDQVSLITRRGVIRWFDTGWAVFIDENKPTPPFHVIRLATPEHFGLGLKVVGNFYENPDLL